MSKNNVVDINNRDTITDALTDLLKTGAQQLIQQAVQVELAEFMEQYTHQLTSDGKASVVRNGYQPEREILTGIGSVPVKIPKV
ncbi:MAG: IS256 family transposase, partial [Gammaproteobacteria bacterium]|nr:IS256 family transposase [Gammaproteobacteria bacterium]MBT6550781.1 IS256 family transposase [Gammaproteobacteria bacterium]